MRVQNLVLVCLMLNGVSRAAQPTPLLDDTRFERGLIVWSPEPGCHKQQGVIQPSDEVGAPVWGLAQWHSRFTLAGATRRTLPGGGIRFSDDAKSVTFYPADHAADIALALKGRTEYNDTAPERGDPWPHLLAERRLRVNPAVPEMESLRLTLRYRLVEAEVHRPAGFDPRRHTAQFVFYLTVQNRNRQSTGFGDYLWFGVPLYDARHRIPRPHQAPDKGSDRKPATGKFIFNPGGERYTSQSAHDGRWVEIDRDILPLIREALDAAWARGYLQQSRDPADYRLMGMNTGWEVTGPWDVEMQLADLSLAAEIDSIDARAPFD